VSICIIITSVILSQNAIIAWYKINLVHNFFIGAFDFEAVRAQVKASENNNG